jgi:hypothetical protein
MGGKADKTPKKSLKDSRSVASIVYVEAPDAVQRLQKAIELVLDDIKNVDGKEMRTNRRLEKQQDSIKEDSR